MADTKQKEVQKAPQPAPSYEAEQAILHRIEESSRSQFERIWGYRDLKAWVDGFYSDGKIESAELANMQMARSDILLDYQIAQDLIAQMDKNSPQYAAAQRLMAHLYNCYLLITHAVGKGAVYNSLTTEQKMRRQAREHNKETLELKTNNALESELLASLQTPKSRMEAERADFHRRAMNEINPERKAQLRRNVLEGIQYMQQEQTNALRLNQVLGLQRG